MNAKERKRLTGAIETYLPLEFREGAGVGGRRRSARHDGKDVEMTPDKLREKGNRWRELGQYDLANIYNQHAVALEEIERLKGELEESRRDLQFVERWANHHGVKLNIAAEEVLSVIQHYPPIRAITEGYEDGKIPDTPNPWDRAEKAERRAERLNAAIRWALGYEDWPERGIGEGPFYWREELRRRADKGE